MFRQIFVMFVDAIDEASALIEEPGEIKKNMVKKTKTFR